MLGQTRGGAVRLCHGMDRLVVVEGVGTTLSLLSRIYPGKRSARRVLDAIQKNHWQRFTSREVLRLDLRGLSSVGQLNPALTLLEEGDVIRPIDPTVGQQAGDRRAGSA